jgi:hypothetical protein
MILKLKVIINILFYTSLLCLSSCRADIRKDLVNKESVNWDIDDSSREYYPISLKFGLVSDDDIRKYTNDSLHTRLKYSFLMPCRELPVVKLNSFSFTKDNDTIPCSFYYRTDGRKVNIIDSLPAIFTNDVKRNITNRSFEIFAECSQSYYETKTVFINYDIEVGDKRIIKSIQYRRKWFFDFRPKW